MPGKVTTRSESRAQRVLESAPYENTRSRRQASLGNFTVNYRTGTSCPPLTAFLETCRPFYSAHFGRFIPSDCRQIACNPISGHIATVACDSDRAPIQGEYSLPKVPILSDARCLPFLTTDNLTDPSYAKFQEICALARFRPFTPMTPTFIPTIPADIVPINGTNGSMNGTMSTPQDLGQVVGIIFGVVAAASITGMALGAAVGGVWRYFHPPKDPTVTPAPRPEELAVVANKQETDEQIYETVN